MGAGTELDEQWVRTTRDQLTLEEKVRLLSGRDAWSTHAIERLGVPSLKVTDGPNGARGDGASGATAACFPVGTALGATWNPDLLQEVGVALAQEARSKGAQILLGPTVNIHRTPLAGRNFECYSEDPLLTAALAVGFVDGLQAEGVGACIKHFAGNEQEFERMTMSSAIPERALREIYLLPFERAVAEARPWSVMGAYNRLDGIYACAHHRLLVDILKDEWGFDGVVISDWGAVHDGVDSANGGCDLEMPGPAKHFGNELLDAVARGAVDESVIDDKVERLLRTLVRSGRREQPDDVEEQSVDRPEHRALARRVAVEATVLLKNDAPGDATHAVLPLAADRLRRLAVIGPNAERGSIMGGGSSVVRAHHQIHPLAAIRARVGDGVEVVHAAGATTDRFVPNPEPRWFAPLDDGGRGLRVEYVATDHLDALEGELPAELVFGERLVRSVSWVWWVPPPDAPGLAGWSARWTGSFVPDADGTWTFGVAAIGRARVLLDGEVVCDDWTDPRQGVLFFGAGTSEVVGEVVLEAGRAYDLRVDYQVPDGAERGAIRFGIAPPVQGNPVAEAAALAAAADAAVVVVGTDGDWETEGSDREAMRLPNDQDDLIRAVAAANPNTVVVLNTGSPVEMPWIAEVPAVLQVWFPGQEFGDALAAVLFGDDDPGGRLPTTFPRRYEDNPTLFNYPGEFGEVRYGEGVFVGYRGYDTARVEPLFPFGHGLSYTTFEHGPPRVQEGTVPGTVSLVLDVRNVGDRAGHEVVQLYVQPQRSRVARPPRELKAFAKVTLDAGATATARLDLDARSFAYFDPAVPGWVADAGKYDLLVGVSSRSLTAVATYTVAERIVLRVGGADPGA